LPASDSSSRKKKKKGEPATTVTTLVRVKTRMTRMGKWDEGKSLEDNLAVVGPDIAQALNFQSKLWKEYAMQQSLPGYEEAASNRVEGVRSDPTQLDRIEAFARRKAGQCLQQAQEEQEETDETQVSPIEAVPVQDQNVVQEEKERSLPYGKEGSNSDWTTVTGRKSPSSQEEGIAPSASLRTRKKPIGDPAKDPRMLLSPGRGRSGRGDRQGRKAGRGP
jgi:hypothetical protein